MGFDGFPGRNGGFMSARAGFLLLTLLLAAPAGCGRDREKKREEPATVVKSSHTTQTADGVTIALRRFQLNHGTRFCEPVFMTAGFLENGNVFDAAPKHSLAEHLALQGHDVWTYDIRGTGASQSPEVKDLFGWKYSIDHFVYLDTPAALQYVLKVTGCHQVLWVSHSTGALMMYGYLETNDVSKVKACVSICGVGVLDASQKLPDLFSKLFFQFGVTFARWMPNNMPIPFRWALDKFLKNNVHLWAAISYLLDSGAAKIVWNSKNMNPNLVYQVLKRVLSNTSTTVFKQFFQWCDDGHCWSEGVKYQSPVGGWSSDGGSPVRPADPFEGASNPPVKVGGDGTVTAGEKYSFTRSLPKIRTPMLVMAGEADPMVPPRHAEKVYKTISSPDKKYILCAISTGHAVDYGHMDAVVGIHAQREVFPHVSEWLQARATAK